MNAVFTSSILKKNHHPIFNRHSANLVKTLEKYVGQPEIDFTAVVITSNFDVVLGEGPLLTSDITLFTIRHHLQKRLVGGKRLVTRTPKRRILFNTSQSKVIR